MVGGGEEKGEEGREEEGEEGDGEGEVGPKGEGVGGRGRGFGGVWVGRSVVGGSDGFSREKGLHCSVVPFSLFFNGRGFRHSRRV